MKHLFFNTCLFLFAVLTSAKTIATTQINDTIIKAETFGVVPNTGEDMALYLNDLIKEASRFSKVTITFQEGRYDFWPEHAPKRDYFISNTSSETECPSKTKTIVLLLEDFNEVTINGNGALFMIHGKMTNFAFVNCEDVKMENLSFDYERPTMSELTIDSITDKRITASINPSSTFAITDGHIDFYGDGWHLERHHTIALDPETSAGYYSNFGPLLESKATKTDDYKVAFEDDFSKVKYQVGQVLTVRDPIRDQVGGFIAYSKNVELQNVNMHYMHGMGILSQFSENITFDTVKVQPRKETGRVISAFADSFHFSGCKGQILIKNCYTSGAHDDAVNVHGTHLKVVETLPDNKINLQFMHHQTYGFDAFFASDTLNFVHPNSLQIYGQGIVKQVDKISDRMVQLTLEEALPQGFEIGDVVENLTWTPSVIIRDNYFSRTNTRGVLLLTPRKSIIENNVFYRTGMHAILIANDALSWYESGGVRDVLIRGNQFIECGYNQVPNNYIINIAPENHLETPGYFVHENILIENNEFKVFDMPILKAKSTKGLMFRNNEIVSSEMFNELKAGNPSFDFEQCTDVTIELNASDHNEFDSLKTKSMSRNDLVINQDNNNKN